MIWQIDKYQLFIGGDEVCLRYIPLTPTPWLNCLGITKFGGIMLGGGILGGSIFGAMDWVIIGRSACLNGGLIGIVPGWE